MGTRCLMRVFDGDEKLCAIYRHFDGYPEGHGRELADWIAQLRLVNGYSSASTLRRNVMVNGAGRMAALICSRFEENDVSIMPVDIVDCGQEYEYWVKCPNIDFNEHLPDGKPIVVEAYSVRGKARLLERVTIPDKDDAQSKEPV